jgi:hypothetical protein
LNSDSEGDFTIQQHNNKWYVCLLKKQSEKKQAICESTRVSFRVPRSRISKLSTLLILRTAIVVTRTTPTIRDAEGC